MIVPEVLAVVLFWAGPSLVITGGLAGSLVAPGILLSSTIAAMLSAGASPAFTLEDALL